MFLPNFQGATILYNIIVVKLFKKFEKDIELVSSNIKKKFDDMAKKSELRKSDLNEIYQEGNDIYRDEIKIEKKIN